MADASRENTSPQKGITKKENNAPTHADQNKVKNNGQKGFGVSQSEAKTEISTPCGHSDNNTENVDNQNKGVRQRKLTKESLNEDSKKKDDKSNASNISNSPVPPNESEAPNSESGTQTNGHGPPQAGSPETFIQNSPESGDEDSSTSVISRRQRWWQRIRCRCPRWRPQWRPRLPSVSWSSIQSRLYFNPLNWIGHRVN